MTEQNDPTQTPEATQNDPTQTLEATTLREMFQGPVLLVTYEGIKKVNITEIEKYEIHTSTGSFHKVDVLFSLMPESAEKLDNALRVNKEVEEQKLRTDKDPHKRPKIIGKRPMRKLAQKNVKVTLRNGHILYGIPIEYNEYNFTMNVNNQMVLVYRHAVYQFEIVNTQKKEATPPQK
ncbi:MAG: hypothetical protein OXM61_19850 [Candidatus Poribacteria bacterium]|nr:hypothetical protein [Candidatus Poribacteria bacterium]